MLTCSIILPSMVKIFLTVAELCSRNQSLKLTYSIIQPSHIKTFLIVTELCSGNENEVKNMDQGT